MRYGICVPNLGEFADPRCVAGLARRAAEAGWDGFFTWDHVVFPFGGEHEVADPWVLLTAVAMATERIRFGPLVTPVARRRPGVLARQVTTLDRLSGATWWLEGFRPRPGEQDAARRRIEAGPPG